MSFIVLSVSLCASAVAQTTPTDKALLARIRTLYDTPFQRGLVNFDCAVSFDFEKHLKDSFGVIPPGAAPMVKALQLIHYRLFVHRNGAVVSSDPKSPDLSSIPHAAEIEESNRNLLQAALSSWDPYASGTLFPLGTTQYHFEQDPVNRHYKLAMNGEGLDAMLSLDTDLYLLSGVVEKPQHIDITTEFVSGPDGLVLSAASTNTNHAGIARFRFTYQPVGGFQIPASINVTSEQNLTWVFNLSDCKVQRGEVIKLLPHEPNP